MIKNIGSADGIIRMAIAIMIGLFYYTCLLKGELGTYAFVLAIILALSSIFRFCPFYFPFGITTYHTKN